MIEQTANRAEHDFATQLVEDSPDALIALAVDGRVLFWNHGAEVVFGYEQAEAVGRTLNELVVPSDEREHARQKLAEVLEAGVSRFASVQQRKDGSRIHVNVSARLILDEDGRTRFIAVSAKDVTELTRLRDERANQENASRRAEESSLLRSEFIAAMSHELRTPLNAVIGFAELMFTGKVGVIADDHREYLGDILDGSRQLLRLINEVLDLARFESGRMAFRSEPLDLATVVGEVRDVLRGPASVRRVRVEVELEPSLTTVTLDAIKFKQVLYGYLSNALNRTAEDGHVTLRLTSEAPAHFRLEVENTSSGQEPLGAQARLWLSKRIVEAQGGHVAVRSDLGNRTVHSIVLPVSTPSFAVSEQT